MSCRIHMKAQSGAGTGPEGPGVCPRVSTLCAVKARTQRGPFAAGDQVQLTDPKGRMHQIVLSSGGTFHTHRGALSHDDLIGQPEGSVVTASSGTAYVALRPLLADYTLAMKR